MVYTLTSMGVIVFFSWVFGWYFPIIFSIIALAILFVINLAEYDVSYVKSHFDGRIHLVRNLPDRKRAANIIAELKKKFRKLIDNVSSKYKMIQYIEKEFGD